MNNAGNLSVLVWANRARKSPDNLVPLYVRLTYLGKRAEISTNLRVELNNWSASYGLMMDGSASSKKINTEIGVIKKEIERTFDRLINADATVSAELIKIKYLGKDKQVDARRKLLAVFEEHNLKMYELIGKGVVKATHTKYETIKVKVAEFLRHQYKVPDMYLDALQYSFITDFEHYLKVHDNISHNVTMSYIKRVKRIINIACQNKWIAHNPFAAFVCTTHKVSRTELESEELQILESKIFTTERLKEIADCYLFSCYTGYAFVDACKLTPQHVVRKTDGELWIITERTKSKIEANVPLMQKAIAIIEKYKEHPLCTTRNRLLPMRSNQKMNEYLHEIAELCGINKKLTTHTARHTFATTVTLENGIPIESVSKMLGHTKITTTQIYSRVKDRKVSNDMKILRSGLDSKSSQAAPTSQGDMAKAAINVTDVRNKAYEETVAFIAPILRELDDFKGLKVSISWVSYRAYLKYRQENLIEWDRQLDSVSPFALIINYLGPSEKLGYAAQTLDSSFYFLERNLKAKLMLNPTDDGLHRWVLI
ncbi:site-specific integrase [Mucilaginibacter sp. UR6-1]|uniref:site-specific integrase n=1 Tax=Mucilaginibacter sp. UR6-1 TaxID=1435643 RepID=UPI001E5758F1|nr:site-specific integrase [Mucilaginibacter sp. UR6-1]MCC8408633.1 site-specific integrase [Mucilaginibacter sp. UR6-1]